MHDIQKQITPASSVWSDEHCVRAAGSKPGQLNSEVSWPVQPIFPVMMDCSPSAMPNMSLVVDPVVKFAAPVYPSCLQTTSA